MSKPEKDAQKYVVMMSAMFFMHTVSQVTNTRTNTTESQNESNDDVATTPKEFQAKNTRLKFHSPPPNNKWQNDKRQNRPQGKGSYRKP